MFPSLTHHFQPISATLPALLCEALRYGVLLLWFVFSGTIPVDAPVNESAAVLTSVSQLIVIGIAFVSFGRGVLEGFRRWASRGIRLSVGHSDELTVDWWRRALASFRARRDGRAEAEDHRSQLQEPPGLQSSQLERSRTRR